EADASSAVALQERCQVLEEQNHDYTQALTTQDASHRSKMVGLTAQVEGLQIECSTAEAALCKERRGHEAKVLALEEQLKETNQIVADLQADVHAATTKAKGAIQDLTPIQHMNEALQSELTKTRGELQAAKAQLGEATSALSRLEQGLSKAAEALGEYCSVATYASSQQDTVQSGNASGESKTDKILELSESWCAAPKLILVWHSLSKLLQMLDASCSKERALLWNLSETSKKVKCQSTQIASQESRLR
ncbi:unnamed protein product, partial [Chrysoparadoxa australica]